MDEHDLDATTPPAPLPSDEEIERRMREALERARKLAGHAPEAASETPEEADRAAARLERIEADVESGTNARFPEAPEVNFARPKMPGSTDAESGSHYKGMGVGLSMAYSMIGLTLTGWGIGKLIDLRSGGVIGQAIGTIIGATMGLFGAVYTAIRIQK